MALHQLYRSWSTITDSNQLKEVKSAATRPLGLKLYNITTRLLVLLTDKHAVQTSCSFEHCILGGYGACVKVGVVNGEANSLHCWWTPTSILHV